MIIENPRSSSLNFFKADVAIVGAGAAGIFLALQLADKNIKVALIEGGGLDYTDESQELYSGEVSGRDLPHGLKHSRMRFFGGSTNCWAGGLGFLDPIDFVERKWMNMSGWPLPKNSLDEYYKKSLDFLNVDVSLNLFNDIEYRLPGFDTTGLVYTKELRFGEIYFEDMKLSRNIHLILNSNLRSFKKNVDNSSINALQLITNDFYEFEVHASSFVLATGGLENARILLLAMEDGLRVESTLAGRYFVDHPIFPIATVHCKKDSLLNGLDVRSNDFVTQQHGYLPFFKIPDTVQEKMKIGNVAISFHRQENELDDTSRAAWRLQKQLKQRRYTEIEIEDIMKLIRNPVSTVSALKTRFNLNSNRRLALRIQMEQCNNDQSYLSLSHQRDRFGLKKINLSWCFNQKDLDTIVKTIEYTGRQLRINKLGILQIDESFFNQPSVMPMDLRGGQHHSGTTRMGLSPQEGVVNENLRVFGISNLHIVGSSVFPTNGWVNPTLSILALTARLGDYLIAELRR